MAFCTACGAGMDNIARVCPKCGANAAASAPSAASPGATPAMRQPAGRNALSIVLIVVAVVIAFGILATVGTVFALKRMAHRVRIGPNSTSITTPFGSVTTDDPAVVAKQLGVDVYPGARGIKGSATVGIGGMQVAAAKFESDAAPDKILEFYQRRYPKAALRVIGANNSMVFSTDQGMVTIKVSSRGDGSLLEIARVSGDFSGTNDDKATPD
jgi:hypothetical protein